MEGDYNQQNTGYSAPQAPQGQYNYAPPANTGSGMDETPMTLGDWVLTILALLIPCAGIILYLVWAFGSTGNVNRRNYCRAYLIILLAEVIISIIISVTMSGLILSLINSASSYY
ncbi:MAG: hypothetical protein LBQ95_07455 [Lachnospiraceae bacterium]|jgi:hypothetical protein|nr:hypothetical protein [Lachnospiraceae bacterium]